jgi:hypothetical protein
MNILDAIRAANQGNQVRCIETGQIYDKEMFESATFRSTILFYEWEIFEHRKDAYTKLLKAIDIKLFKHDITTIDLGKLEKMLREDGVI